MTLKVRTTLTGPSLPERTILDHAAVVLAGVDLRADLADPLVLARRRCAPPASRRDAASSASAGRCPCRPRRPSIACRACQCGGVAMMTASTRPRRAARGSRGTALPAARSARARPRGGPSTRRRAAVTTTSAIAGAVAEVGRPMPPQPIRPRRMRSLAPRRPGRPSAEDGTKAGRAIPAAAVVAASPRNWRRESSFDPDIMLSLLSRGRAHRSRANPRSRPAHTTGDTTPRSRSA